MRKEYINAKHYYQAKKQAPWAAVIIRVEGGFCAFECVNAYKTHKRQK